MGLLEQVLGDGARGFEVSVNLPNEKTHPWVRFFMGDLFTYESKLLKFIDLL